MASKKRGKLNVAKPSIEKTSGGTSSASKRKRPREELVRAPLHQDRKFLLTATAIVVVALLLRIYRIGEQELWLDEAFSFHIATMPNWLEVC